LHGDAADGFPPEFDALIGRLNERVFARLEEERGARRRASIFAFPQQMAALREPLAQFVSDIFSSTQFNQQILLRGVYLTSGTQDGTQIDRLLGSIGRRFGLAADAVAPAGGRGKAFFMERLLKQVVIGESGLAGVNRRLELRTMAWQIAAYAAVVLALVVGLVVLSVSYGNNRAYLGEVANDLSTLRRVTPALPRASLEVLLPQLDAVRAVSDSANRYRDAKPWGMGWGLFQGDAVGNAARDAYLRELDGIVLPRFAARIKQHLVEYAAEPEKLYVYLKAYLMLGDPKHLDKKHLQFLADVEWRMPDAAPGAGTSLSKHFQSLLEYSDTLRPIALDPALVAKTRTTILRASIPQIMFEQLRRSYADDTKRALQLDVIAGAGIEKVLRRRSGRRLSEPVPAFYTKAVFKEATGTGMLPLVKQFAEETWVWGPSGMSAASWAKLTSQVTELYERDYNRAWDDLLNDLEIVSFSTVQQYSDELGILIGPVSPLRGLLKTVVENTSLVTAASDTAGGGLSSVGTRITEGAKDLFYKTQQRVSGTSGLAPGTVITQHFEPIHKYMAGAPAPIDGTFEQIRKIRDQLLTLGPQVGGTNPLKALADPTLRDLRRALGQDAVNVPPPINTLISQIAEKVNTTIGDESARELETVYQQEVVSECRARVEGRYPFGSGGDMPLSDFALVFGYGGIYDKFFTERLDKLVDVTQRPWAWRPESVRTSPAIPAQFERVARLREMFFSPGGKAPELEFNLRLSKLDQAATRLYVDIDGQQFDVKPGAESANAATWPGPKKAGVAFATFEDRVAAPEQFEQFEGPWAWFHMIDKTMAPQPEADGISVLSLQSRYHRALMTIDAPTGRGNPFVARGWRQFSCGA
ncbi:MAG: type VI secretion system membrane subunit TssM, partial [Vicinamibacterales bacterium]